MDLFANHYPVLKYFLNEYYTDVTSNISLLLKNNNYNNNKAICSSIIYELEKNNRLFEVKKLLEDEGIQSETKTNMICNISYFFEDNNITDENKTKLKKILADINMIELWKTLDKKSDKKFDMFQTITTHFTSYNNSFEEQKTIEIKNKKEETIKSIFEYEIQNLTESSYDPAIISRDLSSHKKELRKREFIGFSFLMYPEIANKVLKNQETSISNDLLKFYNLILEICSHNNSKKDDIKAYVEESTLLKNIETIFNEINLHEENETKNLATLLKKNISEIIENESLKNKIKSDPLYQKFLLNQIITQKKKIISIKDSTEISQLLNLNEEQEATLIEKNTLDCDDFQDETKKERIRKIITSHIYKKQLVDEFKDCENLAKKIFLKEKKLKEEDLETLATLYKKEDKTNFSDYEIETIAILSLINTEETKEIISKFEQLEKEKALFKNKIEKIKKEYNATIEQLKSGKNLLLNEKIYIAAISYLENFSDMLRQLTEENLANIILAEDLKKEKALNILISLIESDKKKAIEVVKLMQKRKNYSFQKLYDELSSDQKNLLISPE